MSPKGKQEIIVNEKTEVYKPLLSDYQEGKGNEVNLYLSMDESHPEPFDLSCYQT